MSVFAVIEQGDAVALLGQIGEAVRGDLEARLVPRRVAMRRPADHAMGAFEGGVVGADGKREPRLEEDAAVVPVDVGPELEPGGICP